MSKLESDKCIQIIADIRKSPAEFRVAYSNSLRTALHLKNGIEIRFFNAEKMDCGWYLTERTCNRNSEKRLRVYASIGKRKIQYELEREANNYAKHLVEIVKGLTGITPEIVSASLTFANENHLKRI